MADMPPHHFIDGGRGPAVVVVPSIFGVAADLIEQMEEVAARRARVLIADPFHRGEPKGPMPYTDPRAALARLAAIETALAYQDFLALLKRASTVGNGKVVVLGICFGGPFGLMAAAAGLVDGLVTWHGSRMENFLAGASNVTCPVRMHFGEKDPVVPLYTVEAIAKALEQGDTRIAIHEGAGHGFSHRGARAHDPRAEAAGMASLIELVEPLA